jgi:hypothetical protein
VRLTTRAYFKNQTPLFSYDARERHWRFATQKKGEEDNHDDFTALIVEWAEEYEIITAPFAFENFPLPTLYHADATEVVPPPRTDISAPPRYRAMLYDIK